MKNILVLGGNSQLGRCIKSLTANTDNLNLFFLGSKEVDVRDSNQLELAFQEYQPDIIINCAAYTAVDQAEDEVEAATLLNGLSPGYIAEKCKKYNSKLIHISTDFVFSGTQSSALKEKDETLPLSVYGVSKLQGEQEIVSKMEKFFIIRTSWLYSGYGHNFLKTMLRLGKEKASLEVVGDQVGTPTYAMDLADVILAICLEDKESYGVYHYSNEGVASWYDFAHAIFKLAGLGIQVHPISTADFPTKAIRPAFSVLDKSKIKNVFSLEIPHWRDSLERCMVSMKEMV